MKAAFMVFHFYIPDIRRKFPWSLMKNAVRAVEYIPHFILQRSENSVYGIFS